MTRETTLSRIAATLAAGESILVTAAETRGRRIVGFDYEVTAAGWALVKKRGSRPNQPVFGTLRRVYAERVLRHGA